MHIRDKLTKFAGKYYGVGNFKPLKVDSTSLFPIFIINIFIKLTQLSGTYSHTKLQSYGEQFQLDGHGTIFMTVRR